jgi:hypothetical protein
MAPGGVVQSVPRHGRVRHKKRPAPMDIEMREGILQVRQRALN